MNALVTVLYDWPRIVAGHLAWLPPLAIRIVVGWVFLWTGWQKLNFLPRMIENFRQWGIPAPEILTPFASSMEFAGGLLLLVGLLTRIVSIPMMVIMLVAIASAKQCGRAVVPVVEPAETMAAVLDRPAIAVRIISTLCTGVATMSIAPCGPRSRRKL